MTEDKTLEYAVRIIMVSRDDWVIPCKSMEEAQIDTILAKYGGV
jgi:hypothetical protein